MVDEFQDTSPVNMGIIQNHIDAGIQLIVVGDKNQSIFQFAGAVNAFNRITLEKQLRLTRSFRNGQTIVNLAAGVLNHFAKQKNRKEAFTGLENGTRIRRLAKPQAFISRTNAALISRVLLEVKQNRKAFIVGGADNLYRLIEGCQDLMKGRKTNHSELAVFSDWEELRSYANTDIGGDLKPLVTMIIKRGCVVLLEAIDKMKYTRKAEADIILTTAHKAKGLEFSSVKLASDFTFDKKSSAKLDNNDTLTTQSKNLMYVAITRTLGDLDVSEVDYLQPLLIKQKRKASPVLPK
jgi:superfamily I DNA/RNA helicase